MPRFQRVERIWTTGLGATNYKLLLHDRPGDRETHEDKRKVLMEYYNNDPVLVTRFFDLDFERDVLEHYEDWAAAEYSHIKQDEDGETKMFFLHPAKGIGIDFEKPGEHRCRRKIGVGVYLREDGVYFVYEHPRSVSSHETLGRSRPLAGASSEDRECNPSMRLGAY